MIKKQYVFSVFQIFLCSIWLTAQVQPDFTPAESRWQGFEQRQKLVHQSIVNAISFRNVGPTVMSGRVTDLDVNPSDPTEFYVAYASGGLWHTTNNGTSFTPIFDEEAVMSIGDIAVDWAQGIIWVGTGENNASRSSYSGMGLYKSSNGGKNWQHLGLAETHHIGRIILHPTDTNTVWVAAAGHLYSENEERGIYKTSNGGKTWEQTLFVNEAVGGIDLLVDGEDANTLYAAMWERKRRAWDFTESGSGSGIFKSEDGGDTWAKISTVANGFPEGEGVGRIGLSQYKKDGKDVLYAILDNQSRKPLEGRKTEDGLTKDDLRTMTKADFLKQEEKAVKDFLIQNKFPKKYTVELVQEMVRKDKIQPSALVEYLEDANSLLFDTPIIGMEIYRSDDGGKTWQRTHDKAIDHVFNTYGYYFGQIRVSPTNPDKVFIMGVPILKSEDGGKNWASINGDNQHVDHHALWVNPSREGHLINGNDGGVNISYDDGKTWIKCNSPAVGQFYTVAVDMAKPYNIYGGLQDNGVWVGSSNYDSGTGWHSSGEYPYQNLMGGDGMQVAVDTRDNNLVYTGFQFGYYYRINQKTEKRKSFKPSHKLGERPLRFNWQTPICLSSHNQDILYYGANKVFRSFNQGEDLTPISDDLTKGGQKGDVPYGTLTTLKESLLRFGLIYVGSDDGWVHVTKDGGSTWQRISDSLPQDRWVSRVEPSHHAEGTVYVSLNGYRWDDFGAYIYQSKDYGQTWTQLGKDLPAEPINVIKEDPVNPNLLYVGTDHGLYVSLDGGVSFMAMNNGLPAVAIHDLVVHPRDHDLVVATHGRSIYVANVAHLQKLTEEILAKELYVFPLPKIKHTTYWGSVRNVWSKPYEPKTEISFYAKAAGKAVIYIENEDNLLLKKIEILAQKGLNTVVYDLTIEQLFEKYPKGFEEKKKIAFKKADNGKTYILPGKYTVTVELGKSEKRLLEIDKK